jgi:Flp pilus assembly protein TadG
MTCIALRAALRERLIFFARNNNGFSAVEFALLTPIMLSVYLGSVQIGDAIAISRKVTIATRTVANLTTLNSSVTASTLTTIMSASSVVVAPYSLSNLSVTVSEVETTDANGHATIQWSNNLTNGVYSTGYTQGQAVTLPAAGMAPASGIYLIWCQIQYNYTPSLGYLMTGTFPIAEQIYMSPRISTLITYTSS